jgi:hypothetical protein
MSSHQKGRRRERPRRTFENQLAGWRKLIAAARRHEVELPQLGLFLAALEEAFDEVVSTSKQRQNFKNLFRESGLELKAQSASCTEMASRLKSLVLAAWGRKDDRLPEFGIKLPRGPRKPKETERRQNGSPGYH